MKVIVLVKANKDSEAGIMPTEKLLTEMGKFNEQLVRAGVTSRSRGASPQLKRQTSQASPAVNRQ